MRGPSPEERFWAKTVISDGCWQWLGATSSGYGQVQIGPRRQRVGAHRFAYELLIAPIPDGMQIDHLCRNRSCVNPWHMEPVTLAENVLRGQGTSATNARKTHCIRGHKFTPENTGVQRSGDRVRGRYCRTCYREADARRAA